MSNPIVNIDVFRKIASELFPPNSESMTIRIKAEIDSEGLVNIDWGIRGNLKINLGDKIQNHTLREEIQKKSEKTTENQEQVLRDLKIQANQANKVDLGLALRIAFYWNLEHSIKNANTDKIKGHIEELIKKTKAGDKKSANEYWVELLENSNEGNFQAYWNNLKEVKWAENYPSWRAGLLKLIGDLSGYFWEIDEDLFSSPNFKATEVLDLLFEGTKITPIYGKPLTYRETKFQIMEENTLMELEKWNLRPIVEKSSTHFNSSNSLYEINIPGLRRLTQNQDIPSWEYFLGVRLHLKKVAI